MSHETEILSLFDIVQTSFKNAMKQPDISKQYGQWKSCAQLAGVAACRIAADGDLFRAAALEWVSIEARRRMKAMVAA